MSAITVIIGIVPIIIFAYFVIKGLNEYFVNQREVEKAQKEYDIAQREQKQAQEELDREYAKRQSCKALPCVRRLRVAKRKTKTV
jgi:uncharacterized membrane protein (DUF106 family)